MQPLEALTESDAERATTTSTAEAFHWLQAPQANPQSPVTQLLDQWESEPEYVWPE